MARLAPLNLITATLVLVGAVLPERWRLPVWTLTVVIQWISPYLHSMGEWTISAARVALHSYGYAHLPILFGIVVLAAGVKKAIGHAFDHLTWPQAMALAGGVALFLLGDVWFRRVLSIGRSRYRLAGALAALGTVPLGLWFAIAQMAALFAVLVLMLATEDRSRGISWRPSVRGTRRADR